MRMSKLFSQTLREAPSDAEVTSHQLLVRAGFIVQLGAGIFSYLPLARRAMNKIENIIREEMNAIGGQEITMPLLHPADPWEETPRRPAPPRRVDPRARVHHEGQLQPRRRLGGAR